MQQEESSKREDQSDEVPKKLVEQVNQFLNKLDPKHGETTNTLLVEALIDTLELLLSTVRKNIYYKTFFLQLPFERLKTILSYLTELDLCEHLRGWCDQSAEMIEQYEEIDLKSIRGESLTSICLLQSDLTELSGRLNLKSSMGTRNDSLSCLSQMTYPVARDAMINAARALAYAKEYKVDQAVILDAQYKIAQLEARFIYASTHLVIYEQFDRIPLQLQATLYLELFGRVKFVGLQLMNLMNQSEWSATRIFFRTIRNKQRQYSFIDRELMWLAFELNNNLLQSKLPQQLDSVIHSDAHRYREILKEARALAPCVCDSAVVVRKQQEIFSQRNERFLQTIFRDCECLLGSPPRSFVVLALGSTSDHMRTCYSDFEYTLLVTDESEITEEQRVYVDRFVQLFEFKVLSVGEPEGFRLEILDGNVAWGGCWGRVSDLKKVLVNARDLTNPMANSLLRARCIYIAKSSQDNDADIERLLKTYRYMVKNLDTEISKENSIPQTEQRALANLALNLKSFDYNFSDAKRSLMHPFLFVLQALSQFYDIEADNPWDCLRQFNALSPIFTDELEQVLADLLVLRNQLQVHYGKQDEHFRLSEPETRQCLAQILTLSKEWQARLQDMVTRVLLPFYQWVQHLLWYADGERRPLTDTLTQLRMTYRCDPAEQRHLIQDFVTHCLSPETETGNVTVYFINEDNKDASYQSYLLQNSLITEILTANGEFKKITRKMLESNIHLKRFDVKHFESRRAVWPIFDKDGEPTLYLKAYPEIPGLEIAYGLLTRLLFGPESPTCLLTKWEVKRSQTETTLVYPVLVSRAVQGINFAVLLADPSLFSVFMQTWQQSNREHLFILFLLTNPEDGRPNNFIAEIEETEKGYLRLCDGKYHYVTQGEGQYCFTGRLIPVDNDHIFFPAVSKEKKLSSDEFQFVLKVKTILYCFDAITTTSLLEETIERLLSVDPAKLIESWLTQLIQLDKDFRKLFTSEEMLQLGKIANDVSTIKYYFNFFLKMSKDFQNADSNTTILPIPLSLNTTVWPMFVKLQRLQSILQKWRRTGYRGKPLELLMEIEPLIGKRYTHELQEEKSLLQRFAAIEGLDVSMYTASKTHMTLKTMTALDSVETLIQANRDPLRTLKYFRKALKVRDFHTLAQAFIKALADSTAPDAAIDGFLARPDEQQQAILNALDFGPLDTEQVQRIQKLIADKIMGIQQHQYTLLKLCYWDYLDDRAIARLLEQSPRLTHLHLTGCKALTGNLLKIVAQHNPQLERLYLNETNIYSLQACFGEGYALKTLQVRNCYQLTNIEITAPHLKFLSADHCSALTNLRVIAVQGAKASLEKCNNLPERELLRYLNFSVYKLSSFSLAFKMILMKIIDGEITEVKLPYQGLNDLHLQALGLVLCRNQKVNFLDLCGNQITDKGFGYFSANV